MGERFDSGIIPGQLLGVMKMGFVLVISSYLLKSGVLLLHFIQVLAGYDNSIDQSSVSVAVGCGIGSFFSPSTRSRASSGLNAIHWTLEPSF